MSIENLTNRLPGYAKDIKLNLSGIAASTVLGEQALWGTILASALASRHAATIREVAAEAARHLSPAAQDAAKAAHAVMAMNNIYYRSLHMIHDEALYKMPARLRMTVIGNPGVDKADFELWELAVSAVNGCDSCLKAHVKGLAAAGIGLEAIQEALRIASIVHSAAATLEGEETLAANVAAK